MTHWKSSAIGLCILLGVALNAVHFDVAGHLVMTARDWFMLAAGVAAQIVGLLQKDAGTVEAVLPDGTVGATPAHEKPNDPKAVPVAEVE